MTGFLFSIELYSLVPQVGTEQPEKIIITTCKVVTTSITQQCQQPPSFLIFKLRFKILLAS